MKKRLCVAMALLMLFSVSLAGAEAQPALSFADLSNLEWTFSSGVGAWYTCVWIAEDGTFTGEFHDSEMGETGEGYADGTVYGCLFHGKMTLGGQVDEYTWKIHVDEVALDEGQVPEVIEEEMRFVTCDPYGIKANQDMLLFLPGTPTEKIPEGFQPWAHLFDYGEDVRELPYYGLYDPQDETGFIGEEPYGVGEAIVGAWRNEEEIGAEAYSLLILKNDGTGELLQLPEQSSVSLVWYPEGEGWTAYFASSTAYFGSSDVEMHIDYNDETDQLFFVDADGNQIMAYYRDWWEESELFFSEEQ